MRTSTRSLKTCVKDRKILYWEYSKEQGWSFVRSRYLFFVTGSHVVFSCRITHFIRLYNLFSWLALMCHKFTKESTVQVFIHMCASSHSRHVDLFSGNSFFFSRRRIVGKCSGILENFVQSEHRIRQLNNVMHKCFNLNSEVTQGLKWQRRRRFVEEGFQEDSWQKIHVPRSYYFYCSWFSHYSVYSLSIFADIWQTRCDGRSMT